MRHFILVLAVLLAVSAAGADETPVVTVSSVALDRYPGMWLEIARLPNRFQRDSVGATAGDVLNTCYLEDGSTRSIEGKAALRKLEPRQYFQDYGPSSQRPLFPAS